MYVSALLRTVLYHKQTSSFNFVGTKMYKIIFADHSPDLLYLLNLGVKVSIIK